jgi:Na+/phosphate symporter
MTNNIERIGDSVENIAQLMEDYLENDLKFTPAAMTDINKISGQVTNFLNQNNIRAIHSMRVFSNACNNESSG